MTHPHEDPATLEPFEPEETIDLMDELKGFEDDFENSESGGDLPVGRYTAEIVSVVHKRTKAQDKTMFVWHLIIQGPTHINKNVWLNRVLSEKTMWVIKKDLEVFDFAGKLTESIEFVKKLGGVWVEIEVVQTGQYLNTHINKIVEKGASAAVGQVQATEDFNDIAKQIPF